MNSERLETNKRILEKIKKLIESDNYIFTEHALNRQNERIIMPLDVLYVLKNGRHEEDKTSYSVKHQCWHYAITGNTTEGINLRVIITFEDELIIITVIKLTKHKRL